MASPVIRVSIVGDWKELQKTFNESATGADKWAQGMSKAGSAMTLGVTAPIVAGAAMATKAAAEEQAEMENLANTIRNNVPGATDEAIAANEEFITSLQNATGIADSELRQGLNNLVLSGMDLEEAQGKLATAMDISVAKGKDLGAVTEAIAKANRGNTGALGRLGLATKDATGEALSFEEAMRAAGEATEGAAAAAGDTAAGKSAILSAQMADLAESIGALLLPVLEQLTGWLSNIVGWLDSLDPSTKKWIIGIAGVAAAIGPLLLVGAKMISMFQNIGKAFGVLSKIMATNPWLLLIAAIVALVIIVVTNWDKITAFLRKTWDWISKTAGAVWESIKKAFKAAMDWLVNLFLNWTLPGLIIKNWDKIKEGVANLKRWLIDTWNGIVDWFRKLPGRIGDAVSGMWDGISNGFKRALNWIIGKWNSFKLEVRIPSNAITEAIGLAGKGFTINTPNIPRFAIGGEFRAPIPGGAGLAILEDRERVLTAGHRQPAEIVNVYLNVTAGFGTDPNELARALVDLLQRYVRIQGPIPITVRAG